MKAHLCKCLNCDIIIIDQNSQIGAKEHELTGKEQEMQYDSNESAWLCPVCNDDGSLIDL